jgi:isochorismate synthase
MGMQGFALFRLPYAQEMTYITGEVSELSSCVALSDKQGFVFAPFAPSASLPLLLIAPEQVEILPVEDSPASLSCISSLSSLSSISSPSSSREYYHTDFQSFHAHLKNGDFQKLVLSRSIEIEKSEELSPLDLFHRACERYPRVLVSLAYTPQTGLWLTATPEILLSGTNHEWHTMALAGTMPFAEQVSWSDKNIQEQRYVATYITRQLEKFTDDIREEGPYTARAAHLAHLRSDFCFSLSDSSHLGDLLQALHPTPAVCGLPKKEAFQFILDTEHHQRSYYSGFLGPLFVNGQTNLFVTLRCMQIFQNGYRLYAGGGLLKDSVEESEWQETETKLDTMRHLLF